MADERYEFNKVLMNKTLENLSFALISFVVAMVAIIVIKINVLSVLMFFGITLFFLVVAGFYFYRAYKHLYVEIEVKCTSIRHDKLQFGYFKVYEFEPVDKKKNHDVIVLSLSNDETGGLFKKKIKIREGATYKLYFKPNKEFNNQSYLGYERILTEEKDEN